MKSSDRIELIDVFRGIAILVVVLFHFTARLPAAALNVSGAPAPPVFFGWIGVYFFFAISGYCIFLTLERSASVSIFLARRFSRIYPAFLAAAVLLFVYGLFVPMPSVPSANFHETPPTVFDLLTNLVFLGDGRWVNGSFWSIAAEIKFYVLIGLVALAVSDREKLVRVFTWASLAAAPVWMVAMIAGAATGDELPQKLIAIGTIAPYLPFFAIGILARMRKLDAMRTTGLLAFCMIEAAAVVFLEAGPGASGAALMQALVDVGVVVVLLALLVMYADDRSLPHVPVVSTALARVGFISFSWYLIHENLGIGFLTRLNRVLPASASVVVALLATLAIAYVFAIAVEWRFRKPFERFALTILEGIERAIDRLRTPNTV